MFGAALAAYLALAFAPGASAFAEEYPYDMADGPIVISDGADKNTVIVSQDGAFPGDLIDLANAEDRIVVTGTAPIPAPPLTADKNYIEITASHFVKIELRNADIDVSADPDACAFYMGSNSKARVFVGGESISGINVGVNSMKSGTNRAGIEVPSGAYLEIRDINHEHSPGTTFGFKLTATSAESGAGIGGANGNAGREANAGNILIRSGYIRAFSGGFGAGIGGGDGGDGGRFFMDGGDVVAGSDNANAGVGLGGYGAGIGGGAGGDGGNIFISSVRPDNILNIDAYSSENNDGHGAGIGGGDSGDGGNISINCHYSLKDRPGGLGIAAHSARSNVISGEGYGAGIGGGAGGAGGTIIIMDYDGSVNAVKSAVADNKSHGDDIGAGAGSSDRGNQLILRSSGGEVVGNVILSEVLSHYDFSDFGLSYDYVIRDEEYLLYRIKKGQTLTVPKGNTLHIPEHVRFVIEGEGTLENFGTVYNEGMFYFRAGGWINNHSTIWSNGTFHDEGGQYTGARPITPPNYNIGRTSIFVEDGSTPYTVRTVDDSGEVLRDNIDCSFTSIEIRGNTAESEIATGNRVEVRTTRFVALEMKDVLIDLSISPAACALSLIPGANVRLIADGTNVLRSGEQRAGIEVPAGASLEIRDIAHPLNTSSLEATSKSHGAGIGGADGKGAGSVLIRSAAVRAFSGGWGAGIGGGYGGAGGLFYMDGGNVEAGSNRDTAGHGAGIGGGFNGVGGTVVIVSPERPPDTEIHPLRLRAYSSRSGEGEGAGIGGGSGANGGIVSINCRDNLLARGGGIEAYSSVAAAGRGAGIGGGFRGSGGTVVITNLKGSVVDADIGNALIKSSGKGSGVTVVAAAPGNGADIGAGYGNSDHGNQLILTQSETGDRVVGNVVLPSTILQYNAGRADLPYTMLEYRISADDKLIVPAGSSLRIPLNVTLINDGEIENYGNIYNDWRFDGANGKILNKANIWTSGQYFNKGDYTGADPIPSSSAPAVPVPSNPSLPSLPGLAYSQLPAANRSVWVDYSRSGSTVTLLLPQGKITQIINASADGTADIDLSELDGVTEVSFPRQALIEFSDKGLDAEFIMPRGTVLLSRAAARDIAGRGNNTQLYMRFRPANIQALNAARLAALRNGDVVYELTMTVGGQNISSFNGDVAITVPYTGAQPAAAWYLDEKGNRKAAASSYANGSLRVTLHYFSPVAVGRTDAPAPGGDLPWYYVQ
jgi:hypothetical protein